MSIGCVDPDKLNDTKKSMSTKERELGERLLISAVEKFQNHPVLKKNNYNDIETLNWLFLKKVGLELDLQTYNFKGSDIKKFDIGITEFAKELSNPDGGISSLFKIPRRLLSKVPETEKFVQQVELSLSYYKDHTNEPAKNLGKILKSFTSLATGFGVKPADQRALETAHRKAAAEFNKYSNKPGYEAQARAAGKKVNLIWDKISSHLTGQDGTKGNLDNRTGRTPAGELYLGMRDVLEGVVHPDNLVDANNVPWTRVNKDLMKSIDKEWQEIRKTGFEAGKAGVNNLIRLVQLEARTNDPLSDRVVKAVKKYQDIIHNLEIQNTKDNQKTSDVDSFTHGNLKDNIRLRKYMPHYVLDAFEHLTDLQRMLTTPNANKNDVVAAFEARAENFGQLTNRLKGRDVELNKKYSLDPFHFMNKYIHDIARFNLASNLNYNYLQATRSLERKVSGSGKTNATEITELARSLKETMGYTYDAILGGEANTSGGLENLTRFITSVEHAAKMGGNIRSAIRNRLQKVYEYVHYGKKGLNFSNEFYTGANSKHHNDLVIAAMKKHGISWESHNTSDIQGVEGMTKGAIENIDPNLPGEFRINKEGKMVDATPTAGDLISAKVAEFASGSLMSGIHRRVENKNRQDTFKVAFALAHNKYQSSGLDHVKRDMVRNKEAKEGTIISDKAAENYINKKAGNYAYHSVLDLHFDYAKSGKPRLLRGKAGRVFGQYQNYRFAMFDLQAKWLGDAKRSLKAGDFNGPEMQRMYRMGYLYAGVAGLSAIFNAGFSNLISNDTFAFANQWWDFLSADEETDEGKRQMSEAFYGIGPVSGTLGGPVVSDILTLGEIFDMWSLDERGLPHKQGVYDDTWKDKDDQNQLYNITRVLNGQAARLGKYSLPAVLKGDIFQAAKIETGLYPTPMVKAMRSWAAPYVPDAVKRYAGFNTAPPATPESSAEDNLKDLSLQLGQSKYKNKFKSKY